MLVALLSVAAAVTRPYSWRLASKLGRAMSYSLYMGVLPLWLVVLSCQLRARSSDVRFSTIGDIEGGAPKQQRGHERGVEMTSTGAQEARFRSSLDEAAARDEITPAP